jgi:ribosomal protein S18 acetylase RimI-like enzyme
LLYRALVDPVVWLSLLQHAWVRLRPGSQDRLQAEAEICPPPGPEPWTKLQTIGVLPEWRGSGVARELIRAFEQACWSAGYRSIDLGVVAGNSRALAFYRKAGWLEVSASAGTTYMRRLSPDAAEA